jgi:hypothetical protein
MNVSLPSESVFLRVNSSFPAVCTRFVLMLASQVSIPVPLLIVMVSWTVTPAGVVAIMTAE